MTFTYALDETVAATLAEAKAIVGGKAANLGVMARELGLPVPPGFAITTATCRTFLGSGWPEGLDEELRTRMAAVETAVGRRFGDAADPLLVSVRSGAPISMPGMMDTILNLGVNDAMEAGLARVSGDAAFARACRERFVASFRSIVGVDDVPDDPWAQLRLAVEAVFRSWNSDRARTYRAKEDIPDDLGTAVTVQVMVFGNRGADSATGVLFTRNPATGEPHLYGDLLFGAQGEDVVAGTHRTEPIAVLDERLPVVGAELRATADRLERHFADLCDIEFTIEQGRLWMLQTRVGKRSPQAALRIARDMAEEPDFPLTRAEAVRRVAPLLANPPTRSIGRSSFPVPLATGLPASPGTATGEIATNPEAARAAADEGRVVILVRAETSPDDIHGMEKSAGILTSQGGLASHAAVVARGWGIPAVVGATAVGVGADRVTIGGRSFAVGDLISIDGSTGEVFAGAIPATTEVVPEARQLLDWADELGIAIGAPATPAAAVAAPPRGADRKATPDDCLRVIGIKGYAQPQAVADAVLSSIEAVQPILDQLQLEGLIEPGAGALRPTSTGHSRVAALIAADQSSWGIDAAGIALEAFVALDLRVKEIVTDWQLRDITDEGRGREILAGLESVHADVLVWLASVKSGCPSLEPYGARLARALAGAFAGDARYVARPMFESYHSIWFELHEELIRLAGRTREDEAAAGRA